MKKGLITPLIGAMVLGLVVLSLVYLKPLQLQQQNNQIYGFIESIEAKMLVAKNLADQTVTEAFADHLLEQTQVPPVNCTASSNTSSLNSKTLNYLSTINYFSETSRCNVSFEGGQRQNGILPEEVERYAVAIKINCSIDAKNSPNTIRVIDVNKTVSFTKIRINPTVDGSGNCQVNIKDLDSNTTFTQT